MRQTTCRTALFCCFTLCLAVLTYVAEAQTFTALHTFTGAADGSSPFVGVTVAHSGLLYGATNGGGTNNDGVVFALHSSGSGWTLNPLHEFGGPPNDGDSAFSTMLIGPNGFLYGMTQSGGSADFGTVFAVQPPPSVCHSSVCYWNESVLHSFQGPPNDGAGPTNGSLVSDQAGNIYGTTFDGGSSNLGAVFELSPSGSGWTVNVLHSFSQSEGQHPLGGLVFDSAGNLYGTTAYGGSNGNGTVFELSPSSNGTWTETVLHNFYIYTDGGSPGGTLIRDASGNLYGTTYEGGGPGEGTVFEMSYSNGAWAFSVLSALGNCSPYAGLAMDSAGSLYGTCIADGAHNDGWVFKLANSGGSWTLTDLHDFAGADGAWPYGGVSIDAGGNLYGTTFYGGDPRCNDGLGCGNVWEITQ